MKKITAGSVTGGMTDGQEEHSDWPGQLEKLPQANGGVPIKVTSHMTGNNDPGIEGGINNKGVDKGGVKNDFHKR